MSDAAFVVTVWLVLLAAMVLRGSLLRGLGYLLGTYLKVRRQEERRKRRMERLREQLRRRLP